MYTHTQYTSKSAQALQGQTPHSRGAQKKLQQRRRRGHGQVGSPEQEGHRRPRLREPCRAPRWVLTGWQHPRLEQSGGHCRQEGCVLWSHTVWWGCPSSAERAEGQPSTAPSTYIHSTHQPPTHAFCQIGSPDIPGHKALPTSTLRSRTLLTRQTKTRKRALTQAQDTTSKPPSCRSRERPIPPLGSG